MKNRENKGKVAKARDFRKEERIREAQEQEKKIREAFAQKEFRVKKEISRRPDVSSLYCRIPAELKRFQIKKESNYTVRSYNPERQMQDFIRYLFCKYPVPRFMVQYMYYHPPTQAEEPVWG